MSKKSNLISCCVFETVSGACSIQWVDSHVVGLTLPNKSKKTVLSSSTKALKKRKNDICVSRTCSNNENKIDSSEGGNLGFIFFPKLQLLETQKNDNLPEHINFAIGEVKKYFSGAEFDFSQIKLSFKDAPDFHKKVYKKLIKVKAGELVSYKELAEMAGSPKGARAVGQAVKNNPIPLLIPCHRVVNSNGTIGAFSAGGGPDLKVQMLKNEGVRINTDKIPRLLPPLLLSEIDINKALHEIKRKDPALGKCINKIGKFKLVVNNFQTPFLALLESIVYQQLTGKAAATIYNRLVNMFGSNGSIRPFDIVRAKDSEIRAAGLSTNKTNAIRDLAEKTLAGEVPEMAQLVKMRNSAIINKLTKIRGIGRWTVEMLLIFRLGRADVLAKDDYGLQKGLAIAYGLKELPNSSTLEMVCQKWRPYRSIASWYLWQLANKQQT